MKHCQNIHKSNFYYLLLLASLFLINKSTLGQTTWISEKGKARAIPHAAIREADVMYSKRLWRIIDLKQKINQPLYYPLNPIEERRSLFDIIVSSVLEDCNVTAYNPGILGNDDEFKVMFTENELNQLLNPKDTLWTEDLEGNPKQVIIDNKINSKMISHYEIKEDWFFDKNYSKMNVRIIGICPYIKKHDPISGEVIGSKPLFWIYFPSLREELAKYYVYDGNNDLNITFDALFARRMFDSYVSKESNIYDRSIVEYKTGADRLYEAEIILNELSNFEQDLWEQY